MLDLRVGVHCKGTQVELMHIRTTMLWRSLGDSNATSAQGLTPLLKTSYKTFGYAKET